MQDKLMDSTCLSDLHGSPRVAGSTVRIGPRRQTNSVPEIHVNKRDGHVECIVITCACGEQITVVCDYAEPSQ